MKVLDKNERKPVKFEEINIGEFYRFSHSKTIYMKIQPTKGVNGIYTSIAIVSGFLFNHSYDKDSAASFILLTRNNRT